MMAIAAVVVALVAPQTSQPDINRDVLLTETDAVFLLEPEVVAGPGVKRLLWSPDGTYLIAQRERFTGPHPLTLLAKGTPPTSMPAGEVQFMVYAAPSRKTVASLRLPLNSSIETVAWLPGTSKALVLSQIPLVNPDGSAGEHRQSLFWISASGESRMIAQAGPSEIMSLDVSKYRPIAALARKEFRREGNSQVADETIHFFDGEGKSVGKVPSVSNTGETTFLADGRIVAPVSRIKDKKLFVEWWQLKPGQGTSAKLENFTVPPPPKSEQGEFVVTSGKLPAARPELPTTEAVFIANRKEIEAKAKSPSVAFISSDASLGAISPDGTSVAYVHKGVAMVRPLTRLPKQMYLNMRAAAERSVAVSNAKQAALALIMNASDNDDNLIASGGDWREQVMPYIKNRDILNAFTYTFSGGNMTSIEKPAETEIGYVSGPGGRAVAYADGHVKWIADK